MSSEDYDGDAISDSEWYEAERQFVEDMLSESNRPAVDDDIDWIDD